MAKIKTELLAVRVEPVFYDVINYFAGSTESSLSTYTRTALTRHCAGQLKDLYAQYMEMPEDRVETRAVMLEEIKTMKAQLERIGVVILF